MFLDHINEFKSIPWNDIVEFGQKTMLKDRIFSVSWILSRTCNYACSYCWPYAHTNTPNFRTIEQYTKTLAEIKRQARINQFNKFHFSFSGGEPTAYKHFNKILEYYATDIESAYQSVHMTSNCSPKLKWWKNNLEIFKMFSRASITASYHAEFADESEFIEKLLFLQENNILITINQVMVPEFFDEYYARCTRFHNAGLNVTLKPQSNDSATAIVSGYTPEMLNIMQTGFPQHKNNEIIYQIQLKDSKNNLYDFDQAERFNAFGFNKFSGWMCNSGYQSVIIREPGGEVKRSYSCHDHPLGTIDSGFTLFDKPKICITKSCVSSADSKIPKRRII
jgi:organic radical activating enzyme